MGKGTPFALNLVQAIGRLGELKRCRRNKVAGALLPPSFCRVPGGPLWQGVRSRRTRRWRRQRRPVSRLPRAQTGNDSSRSASSASQFWGPRLVPATRASPQAGVGLVTTI